MEKINIAKLLEDCPPGMELDSTMFENLEFDRIDKDNGAYSIICRVKSEWGGYNTHTFTEYGCYSTEKYSKCVIFPKNKNTWEGFQRPFKDGDIIFVTNNESNEDFHYKYIAIFKEIKRDKDVYVYGLCSYNEDVFSLHPYLCEITNSTIIKLATEEEKQKLFDAIKAKGYHWNVKMKSFDKLIEPHASEKFYIGEKGWMFDIKDQDTYKLVSDKFDISSLKPFESKVLIRDYNDKPWVPSFWGKYLNDDSNCRYLTTNGFYRYCIPYDGNEYLLGNTTDCKNFYKTWE